MIPNPPEQLEESNQSNQIGEMSIEGISHDGSVQNAGDSGTDSSSINKMIFCIVFVFVCVIGTGLILYVSGGLSYQRNLFSDIVVDDEMLGNSSILVPEYYRLRLQPDLHKFLGLVTITITSLQSNVSKQIALSCIGLTVTEVQLTARQRQSVKISDKDDTDYYHQLTRVREIPMHRHLQRGDKLIMVFKEYLQTDVEYSLNISFSGTVNGEMEPRGLYRMSHRAENGQEKWILATNFADNRFFHSPAMVFPCFSDQELKRKVPIQLSVTRNTSMFTLSNMALKDSESTLVDQQPRVWDHFKATPPIFTKQLAFIILSNYTSIDVQSDDGIILKIWVPLHLKSMANYASGMLSKSLSILRHYFNTKMLSKLDMVHVPGLESKFQSYFAINFLRFDSLFLNPEEEEFVDSRERVNNSIVESVTSQWLSQSALFLDSKWNIQEVSSYFCTYFTAFHHIQPDVDLNPSKRVNFIFRMLHYTFKPKFDFLVQSYFINFQNKSELFDYQSEQENVTIRRFLDSWTNGIEDNDQIPIISLTRTIGWKVLIKQENTTNFKILPLTYVSLENDTKIFRNVLLTEKEIEKNLLVPPSKWILFNSPQIGFYRVNYDRINWLLLINQLKENYRIIDTGNRAQLISDAFELANYGFLDFEVPLELLTYLSEEPFYLPWKAAMNALNFYEPIFIDSVQYAKFKGYKMRVLSNLIGYHSTMKSVQDLAEKELCKLEVHYCVQRATQKYFDQKNRKDVSISAWNYCSVIKKMDDLRFEKLFNESHYFSNEWDLDNLYFGLACTEKYGKIIWALNKTLTEDLPIIRVRNIWRAVGLYQMGRLTTKEFIHLNWDQIIKKPQVHKVVLKEFLSTVSSTADVETVNDYYKISKPLFKKDPELENVYSNAIKIIAKRYNWKNNYYDKFLKLISNIL